MTGVCLRQSVLWVVVGSVAIGCDSPADRASSSASQHGEEEVEIATLMGEMQRHSTKLGYSIAAKNQPLAGFYLEEIEEMLEEVSAIEEHDGVVIGQAAQTIFQPVLDPLIAQVAGASWEESSISYAALIDACNRCHAATEHEFIVILEPVGEPPYNQAF